MRLIIFIAIFSPLIRHIKIKKMKNIQFLILIIIFFYSCYKAIEPIQKEIEEQQPQPTKCDFGASIGTKRSADYIQQSNIAYRRVRKDTDKDGIADAIDNCPNVANRRQLDSDKDGIGNVCDNCPDMANKNQLDSDKDGIGNVCDKTPFPVSSAAVVYLDFDGYYLLSTYWYGGNPIQLNSSMLTNAEIDSALKIVREDFKPFNVLITTDSTIYAAADKLKRQRVVITESWEWYGKVGGVSYVGSLFWGLEIPAFVFSSLLKYNPKFSAECISHEIGHTIGLYHQSSYDANCNLINEYNAGDRLGSGSFISIYAPIMGVSINAQYGVWWVGANSFGCNSIQNDTAVIIANTIR